MDLIKVTHSGNGMTVDGRELHEFLGVGTRFNDWIDRQIEKYGFVEGDDFYSEMSKTSEGGRPRIEYKLTIDMAKELCMVENNERGRQARRYFIECERRLKQQTMLPQMTPAEILAGVANQLVEQERRLSDVESRIAKTEHRQDQITEILSLNPTEWRKKVTTLLNRIAQACGGFSAYQDVRTESYRRLEERAKCQLSTRLTNKKQKMALEGVAKSKIDKVNKMDVIADDARLTEIYFAIVKEMAIQHQIEIESA